MTVYLLFLNIPGIAGSIESKSAVILAPKISRMSTWLATGMISFLLIVFAWTMVAAREPFPLSHVPMYGNRMTDKYIGDFKRSSLRTLKGYQLAGRQYLQDEQPWYLYVHTGRMLDVEVWNGHKWVQLGKSFIQGYVNPQLWSHRITRALSSDIQHKLALDFNHPYSNSRKVFQAVAQQRNQLLKKRFQYRLMWMGDDGPIEIARSNP
jgi:hypothetical protein